MAQRRNTVRERKRCLELLDLTEEASEDQIKKSYRKLALKYHPDKNQSEDAKEKFQEISYAYKYLIEGPEAVGLHDDSSDVGAFDESASMDILFRLFPWLINERRGPSSHSTFMFSSGPGFGFTSFTSNPFHSSFFSEPDDHFPMFMEEDPHDMRSPFGHLFHFHPHGFGNFHRLNRPVSRNSQQQRHGTQQHRPRPSPRTEPSNSRPVPPRDIIVISDDEDETPETRSNANSDTNNATRVGNPPNDRDYFDKFGPDIPLTEKDEEEMMRIALELSKSELSQKEGDKNNNKKKEQENKKSKDDKNFSVKVSADYGADIPSGSGLGSNGGQGQFGNMPRQGRDMDECSTYDNLESDDSQDTMSWYDNIGGLEDNSLHSPMTEVHKTYYSKKHHKLGTDHSRAATGSSSHGNSHGNSKKAGPSHTTHAAHARDMDLGEAGRRKSHLRNGKADEVKHGPHNSHIPKNSKAEKARGTHHRH